MSISHRNFRPTIREDRFLKVLRHVQYYPEGVEVFLATAGKPDRNYDNSYSQK